MKLSRSPDREHVLGGLTRLAEGAVVLAVDGDLEGAVGGLDADRRRDLQVAALAEGQGAGEDHLSGAVADHDVAAAPGRGEQDRYGRGGPGAAAGQPGRAVGQAGRG